VDGESVDGVSCCLFLSKGFVSLGKTNNEIALLKRRSKKSFALLTWSPATIGHHPWLDSATSTFGSELVVADLLSRHHP
jgi:hypothetical protein